MAVASLVTNVSCLCISVLKYSKTMSDGIIYEAFVLEGCSKWKDISSTRSSDKRGRSSGKRGIEYYNLLTRYYNYNYKCSGSILSMVQLIY